jgi:hypothetical protein
MENLQLKRADRRLLEQIRDELQNLNENLENSEGVE